MVAMEINTYRDLKDILNYEKNIYMPWSFFKCFLEKFQANERCEIYRYLYYLRVEEYLLNKGAKCRFIRVLYTRKKNKLGNKISIKIPAFYAGKGINIHHKGLILNGIVGQDCIFHGNNCVGSNPSGKNCSNKIPQIGDNVDFGYGTIVIGNISIADNVIIGAGAVVINDITEPSTTWVGIPAKKISG